MGRRIKSVAALWCLVFATAFPARGEVLEIPGSGSPEFILRKLAEGFNRLDPIDQVRILPSARSVGGIRAVQENKAVLARVSRRLAGDETKGLRFLAFARDAVVFAVGAEVNVRDLTATQAAEIFSGKITSWHELGGRRAPIRVIVRNEDESNLQTLRSQLDPFRKLTFTNQAKVAYHASEMVELLDRFGMAIGFLTRSMLSDAKTSVRAVSLDGIAPDNDNVAAGRYPLLTDFGFVYKDDGLTVTARRFLDFIYSESGRKILLDRGLVPLPRQPS